MATVEIYVTLKPSLLDTQGATVLKALHQLGYGGVREARIGKYITLQVDDGLTGAALQAQLEKMCQQLLANPVIEDYEITLATPAQDVQAVAATPLAETTVATVPPSALSPSEQLATGAISTSTAATPDPFAMDARVYAALPAPDQLAMQELAWRKHGPFILNALNEARAAWIVCIGGQVIASGPTIDSLPTAERLAQLGAANDLVPWVFTRPLS